MLTIRLTKLTSVRHRMEFVRCDGSRDDAELYTRAFLRHDLAHFAVETEAKLRNSFFGLIAAGNSYCEIASKPANPEAAQTERIVAMLTTCARQERPAYEFVQATRHPVYGKPIEWLTRDFAKRALERFRCAYGEWKAMPFR